MTREGWLSSAQSYVVDGIVSSLKSHPAANFCWNRTAPSLRLLNKHWCQEMNRHVTIVRRDESYVWESPKMLPEESVHSFLKFPNLTSLDISRIDSPQDPSTLIQTVRRIPKLEHLSVSTGILKSLEVADLEGLTCKSVCLKTSECYSEDIDAGCTEDIDAILHKLSAVRMEQLSMCQTPYGSITPFLEATPSLKRLEICCVSSEDDFEALAALDQLELEYSGANPHSLAKLTSLVDLIVTIPVDSFEAFRDLKRLKTLRVEVSRYFVFDQNFYGVIRRLKKLRLQEAAGDGGYRIRLQSEFWEAVTGLESLVLVHLIINTTAMNKFDFGELQGFNLIECILSGERIQWDRFKSLTSLEMFDVFGIDGTWITEHMDVSPLKNLRVLFLECFFEHGLSMQLLESIQQLINLEYVKLPTLDPFAPDDVKQAAESIKKLPHLMETSPSFLKPLMIDRA